MRVSFSFTLSHQPLFLNPRETGVSVLPLAWCPPTWPSAQSWTVSRAQRCRDLGGGEGRAETPKASRGSIFVTSTTSPVQGTQEASVHICAIACLSVGLPRNKKFQEASGNGNHQAAWGGREAADRPSPASPAALQPLQPLWTPSLTQGSLADVRAGGSSNNKLGIIADLLGTRPTKRRQAPRHALLQSGPPSSQRVHRTLLPSPLPGESFAVRRPWGPSRTPDLWVPTDGEGRPG